MAESYEIPMDQVIAATPSPSASPGEDIEMSNPASSPVPSTTPGERQGAQQFDIPIEAIMPESPADAFNRAQIPQPPPGSPPIDLMSHGGVAAAAAGAGQLLTADMLPTIFSEAKGLIQNLKPEEKAVLLKQYQDEMKGYRENSPGYYYGGQLATGLTAGAASEAVQAIRNAPRMLRNAVGLLLDGAYGAVQTYGSAEDKSKVTPEHMAAGAGANMLVSAPLRAAASGAGYLFNEGPLSPVKGLNPEQRDRLVDASGKILDPDFSYQGPHDVLAAGWKKLNEEEQALIARSGKQEEIRKEINATLSAMKKEFSKKQLDPAISQRAEDMMDALRKRVEDGSNEAFSMLREDGKTVSTDPILLRLQQMKNSLEIPANNKQGFVVAGEENQKAYDTINKWIEIIGSQPVDMDPVVAKKFIMALDMDARAFWNTPAGKFADKDDLALVVLRRTIDKELKSGNESYRMMMDKVSADSELLSKMRGIFGSDVHRSLASIGKKTGDIAFQDLEQFGKSMGVNMRDLMAEYIQPFEIIKVPGALESSQAALLRRQEAKNKLMAMLPSATPENQGYIRSILAMYDDEKMINQTVAELDQLYDKYGDALKMKPGIGDTGLMRKIKDFGKDKSQAGEQIGPSLNVLAEKAGANPDNVLQDISDLRIKDIVESNKINGSRRVVTGAAVGKAILGGIGGFVLGHDSLSRTLGAIGGGLGSMYAFTREAAGKEAAREAVRWWLIRNSTSAQMAANAALVTTRLGAMRAANSMFINDNKIPPGDPAYKSIIGAMMKDDSVPSQEKVVLMDQWKKGIDFSRFFPQQTVDTEPGGGISALTKRMGA